MIEFTMRCQSKTEMQDPVSRVTECTVRLQTEDRNDPHHSGSKYGINCGGEVELDRLTPALALRFEVGQAYIVRVEKRERP